MLWTIKSFLKKNLEDPEGLKCFDDKDTIRVCRSFFGYFVDFCAKKISSFFKGGKGWVVLDMVVRDGISVAKSSNKSASLAQMPKCSHVFAMSGEWGGTGSS